MKSAFSYYSLELIVVVDFMNIRANS